MSGEARADVGRWRSALRVLIAVAFLVPVASGCTVKYDVGTTQGEQLCQLVGVSAGDAPVTRLRLRPLVNSLAEDASTIPTEFLSIGLIYGAHRQDFDLLGEYAPVIEFADAVLGFQVASERRSSHGRVNGLASSIVAGPKVKASADAVDKALAKGVCAP